MGSNSPKIASKKETDYDRGLLDPQDAKFHRFDQAYGSKLNQERRLGVFLLVCFVLLAMIFGSTLGWQGLDLEKTDCVYPACIDEPDQVRMGGP
ncbi:MAG: hypothetical protein IIC13_07085 [SAR324 cluster bacterium]|nr:hypothetical protein [SAR324 cluster bacterium]MCH8886337.1 hypothetical protein [SAR324 cluster bacterium]